MYLTHIIPNIKDNTKQVFVYQSGDGCARIELLQGIKVLDKKLAMSLSELIPTVREWTDNPKIY